MIKQGFAYIAIRQPLRITSQRQAQQAQGVKGVLRWDLHGHALLMSEPLDLSVQPSALRWKFSRAFFLVMLEQAAQKNRLVSHRIT